MGAKPFNWDEWEHTPDMVADYLSGTTFASLEKKYGKSAMTIHRYVRSLDLKPTNQTAKLARGKRRNLKLSVDQIKQIQKLHNSGVSMAKLASMFCVNINTIARYSKMKIT